MHLNPGDEVSVGVAAELTDGCHISLCLKEQQDLLQPDGPCRTEQAGFILSPSRVQWLMAAVGSTFCVSAPLLFSLKREIRRNPDFSLECNAHLSG